MGGNQTDVIKLQDIKSFPGFPFFFFLSTTPPHLFFLFFFSKMSAVQKIQSHPAFIQTQNKAKYYVGQLDKEVRIFFFWLACFLVSQKMSPTKTLTFFFQLSKYPTLNAFEQRTQIPKSYAFLGGLFLVTLLHLIRPLAVPASNLIGWAVPAYLSFKAIETPSPRDDVQWLTYWVIFGFLNFLESLALGVILYYFRWYFVFKTLFILWLQLPAFRVCCFSSLLFILDLIFFSLGRSNSLFWNPQARPWKLHLHE